MSLAPLLEPLPGRSRCTPLQRWRRSCSASCSSPRQGDAAAPDHGLDLGALMFDGRDQLVLDPRDPVGGALEPDPSALDLRADHAGARGVEGAAPPCQRDHRIMTMTFFGALIVAGLFTLLPGRIMHAVVFGHRWGQKRRSQRLFPAPEKPASASPGRRRRSR